MFAIEINLINRNQAGFRKGHSTSNNIYCLHVLISLYLSFGKTLYCTFVDFRKACENYINVKLKGNVSRLFLICIGILNHALNLITSNLNYSRVLRA